MKRGGFSFLSWTVGFCCGGGLAQESEMVEVSRVPTNLDEVRVLLRREGAWISL